MKNKNRQTGKYLRFILLPLASILYVYGVVSLTTVAVIFIVYVFRRDWVILEGITTEALLTIVVGVVIFFPARKLKEYMLKN